MNKPQQMPLKIIFAGDTGVGKSSLLIRQTENVFETCFFTIGLDFKIKYYHSNNLKIKAQIWDAPGVDSYRTLTKQYYRNSHALCLCFSLNDRQTFTKLGQQVNQFKDFGVDAIIYLIGCKCDLQNVVSMEEIEQFTKTYNIKYFQTSAKENIGVKQTFEQIVKEASEINLRKQLLKQYQRSQEPRGMKLKLIPKKKQKCKSMSCC